VFGKTEVSGELVVTQLIDDAMLVDQALRNCIDNVAAAEENEQQIILGFSHYVIARPVGLSGCSKVDADNILDGLLSVLMTTAPHLDYKFLKSFMPSLHRLFSGNDPANTHIRTSLAFCLQGLQNGGCQLSDDDSKLHLLVHVTEGLQTEVKVFLDAVLRKYRLNWDKRSSALTEADKRLGIEIMKIRKTVQEEVRRQRG